MFLAIVRLHVSEKKARTRFMGAYLVFLYFQNVEFFEKIFFLTNSFRPSGPRSERLLFFNTFRMGNRPIISSNFDLPIKMEVFPQCHRQLLRQYLESAHLSC